MMDVAACHVACAPSASVASCCMKALLPERAMVPRKKLLELVAGHHDALVGKSQRPLFLVSCDCNAVLSLAIVSRHMCICINVYMYVHREVDTAWRAVSSASHEFEIKLRRNTCDLSTASAARCRAAAAFLLGTHSSCPGLLHSPTLSGGACFSAAADESSL